MRHNNRRNSSGKNSYGKIPYDQNPSGRNSYGRHAASSHSGSSTSGSRQQSYGSQQGYGTNQPYGSSRSPYTSDQPYGSQQSYVSQVPYGSQRPYSSQQPYGSQQSYGSQVSYGSQRPYGSQQFYGSPTPGMPEPPRKRRNTARIVFRIALAVFIIAVVALGAIIFQYLAQQRAYDDLEQYAQVSDSQNLQLSDLTVDWAALHDINPDIVAWIYVPDTPINYPVVQGADNEEYLHKAFDGSTGWLASAGTIFLDSSNAADLTDRNMALYGHHMNDGSMFACLTSWLDDDEFNAHRDMYVLTPEGNYRLKTFSLLKTTGSDALVQTTFKNDDSYQNYIQDKLDRSLVTQKGDVLSASDIQQSFLFATCEYSQNDGRAVLCAAVVETTVADDPYLSGTASGMTGLSSNADAHLGSQYKEAA